jgi:hypothetical protein
MLGLIQFDPENQKKYGVSPDQSVTDQIHLRKRCLVWEGYADQTGIPCSDSS